MTRHIKAITISAIAMMMFVIIFLWLDYQRSSKSDDIAPCNYDDIAPYIIGYDAMPETVLGVGVYDFVQRLRPDSRIMYYDLIEDTVNNLTVDIYYEDEVIITVKYDNGEFTVGSKEEMEDGYEEESFDY